MGPKAEDKGACSAGEAKGNNLKVMEATWKTPVLSDEEQKEHDALVKKLQDHAYAAAGISPDKPAAFMKRMEKGSKLRV